MSYQDYIEYHKEEIKQFAQTGYAWKKGYTPLFLSTVSEANPTFDSILKNLPEELNRDTVRSYFEEEDLYKGFIACMLWGGINATRYAKGHKGDLKTTNAYKAFTHDRDKVVKKLNSVKEYLNDGRIDKAFSSMADPNENHIPGIGVSFFTKLLYYLSPKGATPKPLIYDKWSTYIHCALLIDEPKENALDFYKGVNKDGTLSNVKKQAELYKAYLEIMKRTAEKNEIEDTAKLEAFLFGFALNRSGHKEEKQRRAFLKKYVLDFFAKTKSAIGNFEHNSSSGISKHKSNQKHSNLTPLFRGNSIRGRQVVFGYSVPYEGRNYYLFIGKKPSFYYLELLTEKASERIEECSLFNELKNRGLNDKIGKDYIYMRLDPYNEAYAKALLEEIANKMRDAKEA